MVLPADWLAQFDTACADVQAERDRAHAQAAAEEEALASAPVALQLPDGERWYVAKRPDPDALDEWRRSLLKEGATLKTWHRLFRAYDAGWTLGCPSPAEMKSVRGWNRVPVPVVTAMVEWVTAEAAGAIEASA